jgi:integrase/recombinase XerD
MVLRIERGKGGVDREVLLSLTLLTAPREYYRWMRPQTYLFPGTKDRWRVDRPITSKVIWQAVRLAARAAASIVASRPPHCAIRTPPIC